MDIKQKQSYKFDHLKDYNILGFNQYDYEKYGILKRALPKVLFKGNSIFVTFLQLIDLRIIMMLKYIERLKRFKYITWYE